MGVVSLFVFAQTSILKELQASSKFDEACQSRVAGAARL